MKQISTRTHILLQIAFTMCGASYIAITNDLFVLACIFLGATIVFSFLTVFSHVPKGQRRAKLILLAVSSAVSFMLLFAAIYSH